MSVTNGGLIYISDKSEVNIANTHLSNECEFINYGEMTINGNLYIDSNSHFYNIGNAVIKETTKSSNSNDTWRNDGTYWTNNMYLECGSNDIKNSCNLYIDNKLSINLGDGNHGLINEGYISTNHLDFTIGRIDLANNSILEVRSTAQINNSGQSSCGIYGPNSGIALFKANKVELGGDQIYGICYHNNLTVAANEHFADKTQPGDGNYPMVYKDGNVNMYNTTDNALIIIPASGSCNPGYNPNGTTDQPTTSAPSPMKYYYAFEDLGDVGDFDFNDVVLSAEATTDGKANILLHAAGGTMTTYVNYNGSTLNDEVHKLFGVSTSTMVNTYNRTEKPTIQLGEVDIPSGYTVGTLPLSITVSDGQTSRTITSNRTTGMTPLVITINGSDKDGTWKWPTEKQNINSAYPDFSKWVTDESTNINWW